MFYGILFLLGLACFFVAMIITSAKAELEEKIEKKELEEKKRIEKIREKGRFLREKKALSKKRSKKIRP